jgi:hypothetical protein
VRDVVRARRSVDGVVNRVRDSGSCARGFEILPGGKSEGVLVAAFQSEREEETRDRAERGSVVRGSDQARIAAERTPSD